jgi:Carboxypeptidase regulatory-like domain
MKLQYFTPRFWSPCVCTLILFSLIATAFLFNRRISAQERERLSDDQKTQSGEAPAAPVLIITPLTWGVVGLDSNDVAVGPNLFPVGARVCNTGTTTATNVVSTFVWDSANTLINLRTGSVSSLSLLTLAAGACTDFYYEIQITRSALAYNTTRAFRITATADTLGVVSTSTSREIYVERLVSQNRNSVTAIKLNGATVPFGGTMNLAVGNIYTIRLEASTATNGYEQIESFINLPNVIFQTLSVSSTYTAPTGYTGNKLYEDACGWNPVTTSPTYRSCIGPPLPAGDKVGGTVSLTYTVRIISGGGTSRTLNTLIYDFSGSSYHYNDDFSTTAVTANILSQTAASVSVAGRVTTADGTGIRGARVTLTEQDGTVHHALANGFGYYQFDDIRSGQAVVVHVSAKRFRFHDPVRLFSLDDNLFELDFVAEE